MSIPVFLWLRCRSVRRSSVPLLLTTLLLLHACAGSDNKEELVQTSSQRIISLVPTITETLFALGAGERVIAVSDFDNYPPEAMERPRVGALINPNVERIFELQPDLVITYGTQANLHERLTAAGIRQHSFVSGSIDHVLEAIRVLGREIELEEEGNRLADEITQALEDIRSTAPKDRPKVFLTHTRNVGTMGSFYSGGMRSYFNELIEIAGGENIFGDVDDNAFQPSLEEVLKRGPEVIVELVPSDRNGNQHIRERLADWQQLQSVPAVQNGRVYVLAGDHLLLVGPRLHLAAQSIADVIRDETPASR